MLPLSEARSHLRMKEPLESALAGARLTRPVPARPTVCWIFSKRQGDSPRPWITWNGKVEWRGGKGHWTRCYETTASATYTTLTFKPVSNGIRVETDAWGLPDVRGEGAALLRTFFFTLE